eukprot:9686125-Lingulodinium_polyedra.AAC.1
MEVGASRVEAQTQAAVLWRSGFCGERVPRGGCRARPPGLQRARRRLVVAPIWTRGRPPPVG